MIEYLLVGITCGLTGGIIGTAVSAWIRSRW